MVTNPDQVPSGTYSLSDIVGGGGGDVTSGSGFQGPGLPYMLPEVTVTAKSPVKNTTYSPIIYYQNPQNSRDCPDCLDPATVGHNLPLPGGRMTYAGGNNPRTYSGKTTYAYVPSKLEDYPPIGHDRRYDNLGTAGFKGLVTDTRAISADFRFVYEELSIAFFPYFDPMTRIDAGILGIGLGLIAVPKTIYQLSQPNGIIEIIMWDKISGAGVTNIPSGH
jgi:hypothetical protein